MRRHLTFFVMLLACVSALGTAPARAQDKLAGFALIPAGTFEMGDHFGFVDPDHPSDETPVHKVRLDAFQMSINDVTAREYCEFLNSARGQRMIEVRRGGVYLAGGTDLLCDTRASAPSSPIGWDGKTFAVLDKKENHPMVCVRWHGAAVYCNWLSARQGCPVCYNTATWDCDFNKSGFRLPTEAEWEYAARGGRQNPYFNYPWGNDADPAKANVPESDNPFRAGPRPLAPPAGYRPAPGPAGEAWRMGAQPTTTPVGFFNGKLQRKVDFDWPGVQEAYQTANGANGYGLYDMAGNVWQWCTEWYERDYYAYSPAENPPGPAQGSLMPDGKAYRCLRGGSWFNGEFGHSRVSNRDPAYFRGPDPVTGLSDADGPWFHIGFRVVRPVNAESRPPVKPTPVRRIRPQDPPLADDVRNRSGSFVLRSLDVADGGMLPKAFTGDGDGVSPALEWSGAPGGTQSYALIMHHTDAQGENFSYWILYDIPAGVHSLPRAVKGVGTAGLGNRGGRAGYTPPNSAGPGVRKYIFTLYALSAAPRLSVPPAEVSQEVLLAAMQDKILASADLSVTHTHYTLASAGEGMSEEPRPQAPAIGNQGGARRGGAPGGPRGGGPRGGGGGGRILEENKTPTSPNPGQTVGLFLNTPQAGAGYTLFAPKHNNVTYLINNEGRVVHSWKSDYEPGQSVYLKPNGHLLHTCQTPNRSFTGGGEGGRIEEYDWDGKLIWEYWYTNDRQQQHHDIAPLPNGNILMLVVEKKSYAECLAAGFSPQMLRDGELYPDSVVEVQPVYPSGGKVVWEWHVWDHLIQDFDPAKANYGDVTAHPERIFVGGGRGAPAFWNHVNSIAYNARLDQILISARGNDEIWFIDHATTLREAAGHSGGKHGKGGDLIYRWGNPAAYKRGTERDAQFNQQHDAEWIPDGLPGAGHVTIFNNGYNRGWSSIEEIVPPLDANGRYTIEPGKPYGPEKPVWHYEAKNRTDFFSSEISGTQRLPNGDTLICAGVIGNLFEITPAGETVWQYVNPMVRGGILAQGEVPGKDVRGHLFNAVFKTHRYAPDYPGLAGRDLTPQGVIELPASRKGTTGLDKADAAPDEQPGAGRGAGPQAPRGGGAMRSAGGPRGARGARGAAGSQSSDQQQGAGIRPNGVEPGGAPPGGGGRDFGRGPLAQALETDGDGGLSGEEMKKAAAALKALDKNGDGKLSGAELIGDEPATSPDGRPRRPGGPLMRVLDADRDDELSASEIANAPAALAAADTNKDGRLTREEVDAAGGGPGPNQPGRGRGAALQNGGDAAPTNQRGGGRGGRGGRGRADPSPPPEVASPGAVSLILGRPTDHAVTLNVLSIETREGYVQFGAAPGKYDQITAMTEFPAGKPVEVVLEKLPANAPVYYRLRSRMPGAGAFGAEPEHAFHTQRTPGSAFTFDVEADPHYQDENFDPAVYKATLDHILADKPDFLIDLGDTFMTEKFKATTSVAATPYYLGMRTGFLNRVGCAMPLFLVIGNHESELGWLLSGAPPRANIAVWATQLRQRYFPCPMPGATGAFYSGSTAQDPDLQAPRDAYYAFTWGDALFVTLDPFWYSRPKPQDGWGWTLGREQYDWLQRTLTQSGARFKFVFIHHLVGGSFDGQGRGGVEFAPYFEWGGLNRDGTDGFTAKRPGWPMPIQQLLLAHGVNIVFHGHDHFFARQSLNPNGDGKPDLVYQEVPRPNLRADNKPPAGRYGYVRGDILGNSGHLRVTVAPEKVGVDYVRTRLPQNATPADPDGEVAFHYAITAKRDVSPFSAVQKVGLGLCWPFSFFASKVATTF